MSEVPYAAGTGRAPMTCGASFKPLLGGDDEVCFSGSGPTLDSSRRLRSPLPDSSRLEGVARRSNREHAYAGLSRVAFVLCVSFHIGVRLTDRVKR